MASTAIDNDPLGRPTPGESATLQVTLANEWWDAQGVTGTLTTSDPLVTITAGDASFGDLPAGGSGANSPDFAFQVGAGAGYNHAIPFQLQVSANGGTTTATFDFTISTRSAEEPVGGVYLADTLWTNDKTYIVEMNVGVAPGVTLTIQAGTVVKFDPGTNLNVGGALIADGTQSQPVRFLKNGTGDWGRIFFDDPSMDAVSDITGIYQSGNLLRWVQVQGAANGIGCTSATPYLSHVTTDGGGMNCTTGSLPFQLQDSQITGNMDMVDSGQGFSPSILENAHWLRFSGSDDENWESGTYYDGMQVEGSISGNYYLMVNGSYEMPGTPERYANIIKINPSGSKQWTRSWLTYPGEAPFFSFFEINRITPTLDEGLIGVGLYYFYDPEIEPYDHYQMVVFKLNEAGDVEWQNIYSHESGNIRGNAVEMTTDGGYIVVGHVGGEPTGTQILATKTDPSGNILWQKTYGVGGASRVIPLADGGYLISCTISGIGPAGYNFSLIRTDADGEMLWQKVYGGDGNDILSIYETGWSPF